jgi:hypothetical protein
MAVALAARMAVALAVELPLAAVNPSPNSTWADGVEDAIGPLCLCASQVG